MRRYRDLPYIGRHFFATKMCAGIDPDLRRVQHVALNTWANYVNAIAGTDIDFPIAPARSAT